MNGHQATETSDSHSTSIATTQDHSPSANYQDSNTIAQPQSQQSRVESNPNQPEWDGGEIDPVHQSPPPPQVVPSNSDSTILQASLSQSRLDSPEIHGNSNPSTNQNLASPPASPPRFNLGREVKVTIPEPIIPHASPKPRSSISSQSVTSPRRTSLLSLPPTTFNDNNDINNGNNNRRLSDDRPTSSIPSISAYGSTSGGSSEGLVTSSNSGLPTKDAAANSNAESVDAEDAKSKASVFGKLWPSNSTNNPNPSAGPRLRHNRGLSEIESMEKDGSSSFSIDFNGIHSNDSDSIQHNQGPSSPIATGNASGTSYGDSFSVSHRPGGKTPLLGANQKQSNIEKAKHSNGESGPYDDKSKGAGSLHHNSASGFNSGGMSERNVGLPPTVSTNGYGPGYGYSPYGSSTTSSTTLKNPAFNGFASSSSNSHGYPNHSNFSSPFGSKYGVTLNGSPTSKNLNQKDKDGFEALLKATESPFSWDVKDGQEEFDDYLHQESDDENDHHSHSNKHSNNNSRSQSKTSLAFSQHHKKGKKSILPGMRAVLNVGTLIILVAALLMLFAGYPIIDGTKYLHSTAANLATSANASYSDGSPLHVGNINDYQGFPNLIDPDTPKDAYEKLSVDGQTKLKLVFSDEFETDGRSFYPGDDPYWEAVDLWYWGTNNYEWYDPAAITTKDGALQITLSEQPIHDLNFRGGMVQSWNKFCFTGGLLEASIRLPGYSDVPGLWPAFWMMGNLGRAGYGASLEGLWPYSYEACDVGTIYNQTTPEGIPASNAKGGRTAFNGKYHTESLSWLQGQRLSACTCSGEDHPGPKLSDGSFKGRGAVEIDVFEAQVGKGKADPSTRVMQVSQSAQFAPFNDQYNFTNSTGPAFDIFTPLSTEANTYKGAAYQQSASFVSDTLAGSTEKGPYGTVGQGGGFAVYGTEYTPGAQGSATWINNGQPAFRINPAALEPDPVSQISNRVMASEPMYIIFNLGISQNFGTPNWQRLEFPNTMAVEWVRVYQDPNAINIGCDPDDYPTVDYINRHPEAYSNAQLQNWGEGSSGYGQDWPLNNITGCSSARSKSGVENPAQRHLLAPFVSQNQLPPFR